MDAVDELLRHAQDLPRHGRRRQQNSAEQPSLCLRSARWTRVSGLMAFTPQPTDDASRATSQQEKALGFNMVRKHIKVERPRWYYWADKLGILVWQDMPSVNSYTGNPATLDVPEFEAELCASCRRTGTSRPSSCGSFSTKPGPARHRRRWCTRSRRWTRRVS